MYIQDEIESMNDLIKGQIPNRLLNILKQKKIKGTMTDLEKLLNDWIMKIIKFIKELWQRKNNELVKWKKNNEITKLEKRKNNTHKKSQNK